MLELLVFFWILFLLNYLLSVEVDSCRGFYSVKGFWPHYNVNFSLLDVKAASKHVIDQHLILELGCMYLFLILKLLVKTKSS